MKKEIKVLENNLINKIAAGEVIERPASIVKELVENSIDAGAKNIVVEIKNGGTTFIKITDDGTGIDREQVKTAFLRHATSKPEKLEDLDSILTLGFRGEALSSIAAISQIEMITKTKNDNFGSKIEIEGGKIIYEKEAPSLQGTTFIVKNIFFNTPARRKFLKKDSIESGYISEIINRLALGHPNISFKYINNGTEILRTTGDNNVKNTAFYVYGKEIAKKLIHIEGSKKGFKISGFIGLPELSRGNRSYENFFINGRYIKSTLISNSVEDAFSGKLTVGKFPIFIINMNVPENTVDVNVHPTKLEVRFQDEDFIYNFIYDVIEKALKEQILIPNIEIQDNIKNFSEVSSITPYNVDKQANFENLIIEEDEEAIGFESHISNNVLMINEQSENEFMNVNKTKSILDEFYLEKGLFEDKITKDLKLDLSKNNINEKISINENDFIQKEPIIQEENLIKEDKIKGICREINSIKAEIKNNFFSNYKIIGQVFNTYWIIEQNNEIFMIDQHSAHEKVIYEELKEKFENESIFSQRLIEPIIINVSQMENSIIEENFELLTSFGFSFEEFGLNCYAIRHVPFIFKAPLEPSFFIQILDMLRDKNISNIYDMKVEKIISMSCKKAVKANDKLSFIEAKALIEKILKLENPFSCPHGRPTIIKMSRYEIEKLFKRVQN